MATKNVVTPGNLGKTLKKEHLEAKKYDVNIDKTTIVADADGVLSTALDPKKVDALIKLSGMPALSEDLGTFSGTTIADASTVKAALQALEAALENQNITGQFAGSAATFAALPTTTADGKPVNNADWAILTAKDGTNEAGIYSFDGTKYVFAKKIPDAFSGIITEDSDSVAFTGDGYLTPLSAEVKIDPSASNLAKVTPDGLIVDAADIKNALEFDTEVLDAFDEPLFWANSTSKFA